MIWIPLVLALLSEPIVLGDLALRPCMLQRNGGGKSRGKWILRNRLLGPTAVPRAMAWEQWEALADLIKARGREMRGEAAA